MAVEIDSAECRMDEFAECRMVVNTKHLEQISIPKAVEGKVGNAAAVDACCGDVM